MGLKTYHGNTGHHNKNQTFYNIIGNLPFGQLKLLILFFFCEGDELTCGMADYEI